MPEHLSARQAIVECCKKAAFRLGVISGEKECERIQAIHTFAENATEVRRGCIAV